MNPFVTVVLPIRNEAKAIGATLQAVLAQDYPPDRMEVLIADGHSTDKTIDEIRAVVGRNPRYRVRVIENPGKIVPTGLNIALREARGDIIVRVDGRTVIAPDYVRQCVTTLQSTGAENVGGRMNAVGASRFGRCVAVATSSPFGVGGGRFHYSDDEEWVDTVYMGAWPKRVFQQVGLFDEELIRDQDDEFNYRLRSAGGKILLTPKVRSKYTVRSQPATLWKQYFQYGYWKIRVLQKHPLQMSPRQFAPPLLVLALLVSGLLSAIPYFRPPITTLPLLVRLLVFLAPVPPMLYLVANLFASAYTALRRGWNHLWLLPLTFAILHLSYGLGFLVGLVRFAGRWGDEIGKVPGWSLDRRPQIESEIPVYMPSLDQPMGRIAKRAFDIVASLAGLLVLAPLFGFVALRIKRESPGPVFFRGARIGRNGRPFNILKFRTMYERRESYDGPNLTTADDVRITKVGRWLRETKLNELPQLWNVLMGEMSLVGPRPEVAEFVQTWPIEARREILSIAPGITSPASVTYRNEESLLRSGSAIETYLTTVVPNKLRLDQLYVRNHTLLGDLDAIFMTLVALLPDMRESRIQPEILYNGVLSRLVRRYVTWFLIDAVVAFTSVALAALLWRLDRPLDIGLYQSIALAAAMAVLFSLVNSVRGLGKMAWRSARPAYAFDIFLASAVTTLGAVAIGRFWPGGRFFPIGMVVVAGMFAFLGFLAMRYRERLLTGLAWRWLSDRQRGAGLRERVLIVGAGNCGLLACWLLEHSQLAGLFTVVGMVDDSPRKQGMTVAGYSVLGFTRRIPELVEQKDIGVILFAIEKIHPDEQNRIIELSRATPARLVLVPDLLQTFGERMRQEETARPAAAGSLGSAPLEDVVRDVKNRPAPRPDVSAGS